MVIDLRPLEPTYHAYFQTMGEISMHSWRFILYDKLIEAIGGPIDSLVQSPLTIKILSLRFSLADDGDS